MKTYNSAIQEAEQFTAKEPRFIVRISWDDADSDYTYLTSSSAANVPVESPAVDAIHNAVLRISGQTQKINPDIATSTIGSVTIELSDVTNNSVSPVLNDQITTRVNTKLTAGDGLRGKVIRVYVGYEDMSFELFDLRLTYIVDSISYKDGIYKIKASDIQRSARHKIFTPDETTLNESIGVDDLIIPVVAIDTSLFPAMTHGMEYAVLPGETVAYIKLGDEVIRHQGNISFDTTNGWHITALERGALNTAAVIHDVSDGVDDNRKPKIIEHVYMEGAVPKVMYGLLTGLMHNYENKLADPFDLTAWVGGAITVAASSLSTPVGWGPCYTVTTTGVGASLSSSSTDYTHGDTWNISFFLRKQAASVATSIQIIFFGGASASHADMDIDPSTGSYSTAATLATIVNSNVHDFNDDWYFISVTAYSTTTGTIGVANAVYPNGVSASSGTCILFGGGLMKGDNVGMTALPLHWHLGISYKFARLVDFKNIGLDLWNVADDTGRKIRIENPGTQDGKKYIEKELLLWMGCFMPIYSTGEVGLRQLSGVLSNSAWLEVLDKFNIVSYGDLTHDMLSVINHIILDWNWVDSKEEFTKQALFIDADSVAIHGSADEKRFKFHTVHTATQTDEDLLTYFDILRDRYSGPPLLLPLKILPSQSKLEVGDTVKVQLDQIMDFNSGATLDRTFELQQVTTDWMSGDLSLKLFGSSQAAGALVRTALSTVLLDTFYTQGGTELSTVLTIVAGVVTVSGTLTGHVTDVDDATAIYYYDGNLEINAGVTVSITENVQLRIKGHLTVDGDIEGVGAGATKGAATTLFENGTITTTYSSKWVGGSEASPVDYDYGEQGYFGFPKASKGWWSAYYQGTLPPHVNSTPTGQRFDYELAFASDSGEYENLDPTISRATVPYFQLVNDQQGNTLTGYPKDLRGNAGAGGTPYIHSYGTATVTTTLNLIASGGAGGDGGAGLLIIARGMSFGGNGYIDLSGGDSSIGAGYTQSTGKKFYGSAGASGAPGVLLVFMDGNQTNPDITNNQFIAKYGDAPVPGSTIEINQQWIIDRYTSSPNITQWAEYGDVVFSDSSSENVEMFAAAHRLQYIPEDETPVLDVSVFPSITDGLYNDLLYFNRDDPPVSNVGYGREVDITNDGSRFLVGGFGAVAVVEINVVRSATNPIREQAISDPSTPTATSTGWAYIIQLSEAGDRFVTGTPYSQPGALANQGEVWVYSRSGVTWSVEQTIVAGTPVASGEFGVRLKADSAFENMLIGHQLSGADEIQYWTRSGAAWTYQSVLPVPSGIGSNYPLVYDILISANGEWAIVGDQLRITDSVSTGAVHVFKRTGTAWAIDGDPLIPASDLAYGWGRNEGSLINADGSVIIVGSLLSNVSRIAVYHRVGDTYTLVQTITTAATSTNRALDISDNGLVLLTFDSQTEFGYVYRRAATSQPFALFQTIDNTDDSTWSSSQAMRLSSKANYLITGNYAADSNAGAIHAFRFDPKAD